MNEYGIMHGSIFVVHIHEARDLPGTPTVYTEVLFDGQRQATQAKPATNRPVWNERFSFDVVTGKEQVVVNVCSTEFAGRRVLGTCTYELKNLLAPDYTFDDWLELVTPAMGAAQQVMGHIKLSLQWIISRVDFFHSIINKIEKGLTESKNELGYYSEQLNILPGSLFFFSSFCKKKKIIITEPFETLHTSAPAAAKPSVAPSPARGPPPEQTTPQKVGRVISQLAPSVKDVYVIEERFKGRVDQIAPQLIGTLGLSQYSWSQLSNYATLGYLILSCLVLFARPDFVNALLAAMCYYAVAMNRKQLEENYRPLLGLLAGAVIYDLLWFAFSATVSLFTFLLLSVHVKNRFSLQDFSGDISADGGNENTLRYIALFFSIISLIYKVLLFSPVTDWKNKNSHFCCSWFGRTGLNWRKPLQKQKPQSSTLPKMCVKKRKKLVAAHSKLAINSSLFECIKHFLKNKHSSLIHSFHFKM